MARLPAAAGIGLAAAVLLLAAGISPGHGQLELVTNPMTGCLALPGGQFPSPLLDAYKFLANLQPMRIVSWHKDTKLSVASDGKGYPVLAETSCSDPKQLWVRHYLRPSDLNGAAAAGSTNLTVPSGDEQFALVSIGAIIDSKELQAMEYLEGRGVYPNIKLAPYNISGSVPLSMLWTKDTKLFGDGAYKIRPFKDQKRIMASTGKNRYVDVVHDSNVEPGYYLWKIQGFLLSTP